MSLQIEIKGLDRLLKRLNNAKVKKELTEAMDKSVVVVHERAATYPPSGSSSYRRTRRLGNSWDMKVTALSGDIKGVVSNPTEYGPWVMGADTQARVHKGRWATTTKIIEEKRQKIFGFFEQAVDRIFKGF